MRPDDLESRIDQKQGNPGEAERVALAAGGFEPRKVDAAFDRTHHPVRIDPAGTGNGPDHLRIPDIPPLRKIRPEHGFMKGLVDAFVTGELRSLQDHAGIGQESPLAEYEPELLATLPNMLPHSRKIAPLEKLRIENPLNRRLRMQLIADPLLANIVFLLQQIDNALADIAERSDVVREDSESY